jgi:hypothetical protein
MENIKCYLKITIILIAFFLVVLFFTSKQGFTFLQDDSEKDIHYQDTRYEYPYEPPVNPIALKSELVPFDNTLEVLKIPLQMNVPNDNEQLRSQVESITPYNYIKYCI